MRLPFIPPEIPKGSSGMEIQKPQDLGSPIVQEPSTEANDVMDIRDQLPEQTEKLELSPWSPIKDDHGMEINDPKGNLLPKLAFSLLDIDIKTDDNGNIYSIDGNPIPNQTYYLDGHEYKTDDNGNVYCIDGVNCANHSYMLDGKTYRTDDNGKVYMVDGQPYADTSYSINGHTYETDASGQIVRFDGKDIKDLSPDEFNALQRSQIAEGLDRIAQGEHLSNAEKGNLGEMMMDQYYVSKGYTPINQHRVTSISDNKEGHAHGIDGVYEKDGKYVIADAKYDTSKLNPHTKDGPQMSETWIDARLDECVGKEKADQIREANLEGNVETEVFHIDKPDQNGSATCDVQSVDTEGTLTGEKQSVGQFSSDGSFTESADNQYTKNGGESHA